MQYSEKDRFVYVIQFMDDEFIISQEMDLQMCIRSCFDKLREYNYDDVFFCHICFKDGRIFTRIISHIER